MKLLTDSDMLTLLRAAPVIGAIVAAPWAMRHLRRWAPPPDLNDPEAVETLRRRNAWIDNIGIVLFFGGFYGPLGYFWNRPELKDAGLLVIGLALGGAVALPNAWFGLATLPFGLSRYREFWRFYEQRYQIGLRVVLGLYAILAVLGIAGAVGMVGRGLL